MGMLINVSKVVWAEEHIPSSSRQKSGFIQLSTSRYAICNIRTKITSICISNMHRKINAKISPLNYCNKKQMYG